MTRWATLMPSPMTLLCPLMSLTTRTGPRVIPRRRRRTCCAGDSSTPPRRGLAAEDAAHARTRRGAGCLGGERAVPGAAREAERGALSGIENDPVCSRRVLERRGQYRAERRLHLDLPGNGLLRVLHDVGKDDRADAVPGPEVSRLHTAAQPPII